MVSGELVERLLETAGVALLGLRQGLEPVGDLVEALVARRARHARIHVGVLVGLAGDGRLEVQRGIADRLAGRRIPDLLRSEEHTSELQSLMRISYAVFCLKKKKKQ